MRPITLYMRPSANIYCSCIKKITVLGTGPHMLGIGSHVLGNWPHVLDNEKVEYKIWGIKK